MEFPFSLRLAVDAVVFGYRQQQVSVLLVRRNLAPLGWALPGGFVRDEESLESAVRRELTEETGVSIQYLEQLYTFGEPARDPRGRVVSVAYYALVKPDAFALAAATDADDAQWFDVKALPDLLFDHADILAYALGRLRAKLTYQPIGFGLLPDPFLFSDLERLYATLLDRPFDRRNFRKKALRFGILHELPQKVSDGKGRPASLYQFDEARYRALKSSGFYFELT